MRNGFDQGDLGRRRFILDSAKIFKRSETAAPRATANPVCLAKIFLQSQE
jgi:hypothetical protein